MGLTWDVHVQPRIESMKVTVHHGAQISRCKYEMFAERRDGVLKIAVRP